MERITLEARERQKKGKGGARSLRRDGLTPAVVYRAGSSTPIEFNTKEFVRFMGKVRGEQFIANLQFPDSVKQAIVKDYQVDPVKGSLLHVDFQEISATEAIRVLVHVALIGEPVGVKRDGGLLQQPLREIEIECIPDKIPGHLSLEVSQLEIGQSLHVSDLALDPSIRILHDPDEVVVKVTALKEAPAVTEEAQPEAAEPEVIKKGKKTAEEEK